MDREQFLAAVLAGHLDLIEVEPVGVLPPLERRPRPRPLDEDAAHRLGGGGEEVPPTVPARDRVGIDEPQVHLVDQGGGLERLAGLLLRQPLRGELAELVVDQRQQLLRGAWVALLDVRQNPRHIAHIHIPL